jgi:hypothetical protein
MSSFIGYQVRHDFETTTSYSEDDDEEEGESESDTEVGPDHPAAVAATTAGTPMSEEEERIFIKQDNGQFIAVRPSQVLFQKSNFAVDPRNTGSRKKRTAPVHPHPPTPLGLAVARGARETYEMSEQDSDTLKN